MVMFTDWPRFGCGLGSSWSRTDGAGGGGGGFALLGGPGSRTRALGVCWNERLLTALVSLMATTLAVQLQSASSMLKSSN